MPRHVFVLLVATSLSACAALEPQGEPVAGRIEALNQRIAELQTEMAQTRQHVQAVDITQRTTRNDLSRRMAEVNTAIERLPGRIADTNQCVPQTTITQECDNTPQRIEVSGEKAMLGELESVWLAPPGVHLIARIDTGATSSSLHAENIVEFERDGEDWVRFDVPGEKQATKFEAEVVRSVRVVQQADPEGTRRPVVALRVRLAQIDETVEFTLADRSHLDNALILGRNFLQDIAVVDVGRRFVQPKYSP